ncbi:MAG: D-alanyl-D-alanine carboxypeptidase [Eubacterium sp.]|nr:D-alanyl-D-alanine carboxypeptidase [Eubacterium sp.]
MVKISKSAVDEILPGYSNANLQVGEEQSVYTMLQALLIPSANEAAYALAEHVSGSAEAFAKLCNKRAKELGCKKLHFVNPNGVHDNNHYCCAYDLYLIARECQKYETFNEIVKTSSFSVPPSKIYKKNDRTYQNTNELIIPTSANYYFPSCTGIKTGHTTPAGECLVSSSSKDGLNLICVVLHGQIKSNGINERFSDSKRLFEYVYNKYSYKKIADKSEPLGQIEVKGATDNIKSINYYIQTDINSISPNSSEFENIKPEITIEESIKAPIKQNQVLGTATYKIDGLNYSTNIISRDNIEKMSYGIYIVISILIIIGFLIIIIALRKKEIIKSKKAASFRRSAVTKDRF